MTTSHTSLNQPDPSSRLNPRTLQGGLDEPVESEAFAASGVPTAWLPSVVNSTVTAKRKAPQVSSKPSPEPGGNVAPILLRYTGRTTHRQDT